MIKIRSKAFVECDSLENVVLPRALKEIGELAFDCCNLQNICVPSSVTQIGSGAFASCDIATFEIQNGSPYYIDGGCIVDSRNKRIVAGCVSSEIPRDGSVTGIAKFAFCDYDFRYKEITVPLSIENVEENAFCYCTNTVINCKAKEKPKGWNERWYQRFELNEGEYSDEDGITVHWGV